MGLSRLNNFLKSSRGTILYVDPSSFDSTDSIENSGNSLTRPFKTIQRALIEAARFSYQRGLSNDRFNKTTILVYPGDHLIDNRPGYIPTASSTYSARSGETGLTDLTEWVAETNLDLTSPSNALYKLNSIHGGVIVPRGTSVVALDLRKTKIRPTYVPDPENDNIESSCIFRVTGSCYFWQFSVFDADPNGNCYKNYTTNLFVPNFSHHKLRVFEYADGVNPVNINDTFLSYSTTRTDLDMYYEKVAAVYGPSSGREIAPDYGDGIVDIQPMIDEYRIVGPKGKSVGITSIFAGNGTVSSTTITVNVSEAIEGLSVDSPIEISGVGASGYDGQYVIATAPSTTQVTYKVQNSPIDPSPTFAGSSLSLVVDSVTSSSPYIFNISLRSAWGMCGLLADGDKATGFKSMVVAQFTGIGLQKDENAFVKYDEITGAYKDSTEVTNLHTNSRSRFKPQYENFHIKATNDSFLQLVSVFAIGYANHIVTENGGDIALNNSNSNFGAKALISSGFKRDSFAQDDYGYITHIIPPKEIESKQISVEFLSLDVGVTTQKSAGAATTDRLYLYNQTNRDEPPTVIINGYHIGAKQDETLNLQVYQSNNLVTYSSKVVMPSGNNNLNVYSSEKISTVSRTSSGINSITANLITLTQPHAFTTGESVRVISDNAHLPDGISPNQLYYVSLVGVSTNNQIYLSKTLNSSIAGTPIALNNKGGVLNIVSRVSDKTSGDIGHPVQWDGSQWYIGVSTSNNEIYDTINTFGVGSLGEATTRTYVTRKPDSRSLTDTLYRVRYVLPKDSQESARPPVDGYILQESSNILGNGQTEISQLYSNSGTISNSTQLRNPRFIANATWSSNVATITTEIPHLLSVGDEIKVSNVSPSVYNGTYTVSSIVNAKQFRYSLVTSTPSQFANNTTDRDQNLPYFVRKKYSKIYQIYRTQEVQPYVRNIQDGVYYLTLINHSNKPTVSPFTDKGFSQPVVNLYPQTNNDNAKSDPDASSCHALPDQIGTVIIDDLQNSITKETLEFFVVGFGITDIRSSSGTSHTIYTSIDHGLSGITSVSIVSAGTAYGVGSGSPAEYYNARLVGFAGSITGSNATAKVSVDGAGQITDVKIIDGGSAYGIGNTVSVVGIATTAGHVAGVLRVESVYNNTNDTLRVFGISSSGNSGYNTVYRISEIGVGKSTEINVVSTETISGFSTLGLGITITTNSRYVLSSKAIQVSTFTYSSTTGLATIGFSTSHGLSVNQKIRIEGANESAFNGDFIVKKLNSKLSLIANLGVTTSSTSATGTIFIHTPPLTSYGGDLVSDTENISGRLIYDYDGVTTFLSAEVLSSATSPVSLQIQDAVLNGLDIGDYLLIDNEIFRIKETVSSDVVIAFRSTLGSPVQTHDNGSVVRRIRIRPVEFRRNSIIRASGHTFEYLGFGPGNYSTALPEKQDRVLTNSEKFLSQSTKSDGGIIVYTGMNSDGDFFAGNKKINSATGKEETFDTPFPTSTGEKDISSIVNVTETQKLFVSNSVRVEGGKDKNTVSEFDGPVVFNSKVTSSSEIEASALLVQGDEEISRRISISESKPLVFGNYGDIKFNSIPKDGSNVGWVYATDNQWKPFGWVNEKLYGVGISTSGGTVGISTLLNIVAIGITLSQEYDTNSGVTTLTFTGAAPLGNTIGVYTGSPSTSIFAGNSNAIKFVGSQDGFGVNFIADYDSTTGFTTVTIKSPLDPINFSNTLSRLGPTTSTRSPGTRIVYYDQLSSTNVDYATGVGADDSLWWSVPQNNSYSFKWYGGKTEIASLASNGSLTILGDALINGRTISAGGTVSGSRFISTVTTGTSPISVASSTLVSNLNANYLGGFVSAATTTPNTIVRRDASNNINGNVSHLIHNVSGAQRGEWYTDIPSRLGYTPFNRAGDISSGISTFTQISDIYKNGSTVGTTLTCDFSTGPITRTTSSNISVINISNVPTTDLRATNHTVILNAATTVSNLASIQFQINGVSLSSGGNSIRWLNNLPPSGTAAGYYFFGLTIFRVGTAWEVIAVFASYT